MKPNRRYDDPIDAPGIETLLAHFAEPRFEYEGAAAPPIYQTSTFMYPSAAEFAARRRPGSTRHDYTRVSNPTTAILEAKLARLEHGTWAHCFGSGMGAISSSINACVESGSHVVCVEHVYGPTRSYLSHLQRFGVETTYVPGSAADAFVAAIRPSTRLMYLESPTSGYFDCPAIAPLTEACRARGVRTIFDNSWATPVFLAPLGLGIDIVVHSASKYLNGHSDIVAGVAIVRDDGLAQAILKEAELGGAAIDPFAAWLMLRGLRTLPLRMQQHQKSGLAVARALEAHAGVRRVLHPGLASHPDHATAAAQMCGYAGLFSISLRDQTREAAHRFLDRLRLFGQGVSWGGHESLAIGGTFFAGRAAEPEWLIRLHCGLESTDDLVRDVLAALED
jgi:cystathionine beta-lyase